MPSSARKLQYKGKPWKALYKGKWLEIEGVEDQGDGKQNKYYLKGISDPVAIEDLDMTGIAASTGDKMDKDKILNILAIRHKDRSRESLESVTADVFYSGEPEAVLASGDLVDKLFERFEKKHFEVEAKKGAAVDNNEFCPICKLATANIKLADDRPAKWCSRHHVIFPCKI